MGAKVSTPILEDIFKIPFALMCDLIKAVGSILGEGLWRENSKNEMFVANHRDIKSYLVYLDWRCIRQSTKRCLCRWTSLDVLDLQRNFILWEGLQERNCIVDLFK